MPLVCSHHPLRVARRMKRRQRKKQHIMIIEGWTLWRIQGRGVSRISFPTSLKWFWDGEDCKDFDSMKGAKLWRCNLWGDKWSGWNHYMPVESNGGHQGCKKLSLTWWKLILVIVQYKSKKLLWSWIIMRRHPFSSWKKQAASVNKFWQEHYDFWIKESYFKSMHIMKIVNILDCIVHEWMVKLGCKSSLNFLEWGRLSRTESQQSAISGKESNSGQKNTNKQVLAVAACNHEKSALWWITAQKAGKLYEVKDFEQFHRNS